MQIQNCVSISQVVSGVVVGRAIPKMGNCDFWAMRRRGGMIGKKAAERYELSASKLLRDHKIPLPLHNIIVHPISQSIACKGFLPLVACCGVPSEASACRR